jgi:hypothetical protein
MTAVGSHSLLFRDSGGVLPYADYQSVTKFFCYPLELVAKVTFLPFQIHLFTLLQPLVTLSTSLD